MMDLNRFLENPFDDRGISLAEQLSFSSDHLARMIANNPGGILSTRITATTSALTLVQDSATDDQTKKAIRRARKQVKDAFRKTTVERVAMLHGSVVARFGPNAPEIAECFPEGRSIFSSATDDRLAQHLEALKNALTAYAAEVGAPVVTAATDLLTGWEAVFAQSESSGGNATTSQEGKRLARENLSLMLFLNLLKLAEMFPRQPERLALYMNQSLLEDTAAEEEEPPTPTPPPAP